MSSSPIRHFVGDREGRLRRRAEHYNDPGFGARTQAARRRAVVMGVLFAIGVTVLGVALTAFLQGYVNLALSLPTSLGIWYLWLDRVRVSGRGLTELPPGMLDERQRIARAHAYERSYRLLLGGIFVLPTLGFIDRFADIDAAVFFLIGLVALLLALAAPSVVLAWTEPSEAPVEHEAGV